MLTLKSELEEIVETRMARLLNDIHQDIQDVVKLQQHENLEDIFQQEMNVKRQLKRHPAYQKYAF